LWVVKSVGIVLKNTVGVVFKNTGGWWLSI
jgi:hypothetical protein